MDEDLGASTLSTGLSPSGSSQQAVSPAAAASIPSAGFADYPLETRLQLIGLLIAHYTDSVKTYAGWLARSRDMLAETMRHLDEALSEVEKIAADPFGAASGIAAPSGGETANAGSTNGKSPVAEGQTPEPTS